jgi:hypothetical protein
MVLDIPNRKETTSKSLNLVVLKSLRRWVIKAKVKHESPITAASGEADAPRNKDIGIKPSKKSVDLSCGVNLMEKYISEPSDLVVSEVRNKPYEAIRLSWLSIRVQNHLTLQDVNETSETV